VNEIEQLRQQIIDLEAEATELKLQDSGKKTALNGTFGKLFSRYSIFYAPEFGIAVTIGGQLSLLMLIERMELAGIRVISANTDGVELSIPFGREWMADSIIKWWQEVTGLVLEDKNYLALYSRDVNNYISLQFDGSVKRKGVFGESGVLNNKHPDVDICSDAVVAFLSTGKPLRDTIVECQDVRKFVRVRGAKGGAVWFRPVQDRVVEDTTQPKGRALIGGVYMGRAVRWYYAKDSQDYILDGASLNKVAGSDGARPVMELPDHLPSDIDYHYYVTVAEKMLDDIGYGKENQ
jgi:DNA polymerase elongation subunit (family B)